VALAHNLNLTVIAEGVETAAQLAQVEDLRCEYAQGYYFAQPADQQTAWSLVTHPSQELAPAVPGGVQPSGGVSLSHSPAPC